MSTPDHAAIFHERMEHWIRLGCAIEPVDRGAAADVIAALYQLIGKPRPRILFFSSPLMCLLAGKALFPVKRERPAPLWRRIRMQLWNQFDGQFLSQIPRTDFNLCLWMSEETGVDSRLELLLGRQLRQPLERELARRPGRTLAHHLKTRLPSELTGQRGGEEGAGEGGGTLSREHAGWIDGLTGGLREWVQEQPGSLVDPFTGELMVFDSLRHPPASPVENCCAGPWWRAWLVLHDYLDHIGAEYPPPLRALLRLWIAQARQCHCWFPYEGVVLASERPCAIRLDANNRLHSDAGAALEYRDGFGVYAVHGVQVDPHVITHPASITIAEVERERNAEVRRILIERYGWPRYIQDCGAEVVDGVPEDHPIQGLRGARLLRKGLPGEPEPIVYLEMVNSTPGPDGIAGRYLERIDPKAYGGDAGRLCHAAMASRWRYRDEQGRLQYTFERWQDYLPSAES